MRTICVRHKTRPAGEVLNDQTEWLVLEQSPSFYIVYRQGSGIGIKLKSEYEEVTLCYGV